MHAVARELFPSPTASQSNHYSHGAPRDAASKINASAFSYSAVGRHLQDELQLGALAQVEQLATAEPAELRIAVCRDLKHKNAGRYGQ